MEQAASPETRIPEVQAKNRLRSLQRREILDDYFKNPSKRELIQGLIPSDRPRPDTAVDAAALRHLAEALGKDTHTALFELAATSNDPMELYNIILNIAQLKKVESSTWKFKDSEDRFLSRKLPEFIDVSEESENQIEDNDSNPQHLLESFFYTLSIENVPLEDKRQILKEFYSAKTLMPPIFGNEASLKIYGPESSFWDHVDGSWIDPKLVSKDHTTQPKTPSVVSIVVSGVASGMKDRLDRLKEEITQAPQITALEGLLKESKAKGTQLEEDAQGVQKQLVNKNAQHQNLQSLIEETLGHNERLNTRLAFANDDIEKLKSQLREAQRQQAQAMRDLQMQLDGKDREIEQLGRRLRDAERRQTEGGRSAQGQPKKTPFEILKIPPTSTSSEITTAYRRLVRGLHPDVVMGKLKNSGVDAEATEGIGQLAEERLKDINLAYEDLRRIGRVRQ